MTLCAMFEIHISGGSDRIGQGRDHTGVGGGWAPSPYPLRHQTASNHTLKAPKPLKPVNYLIHMCSEVQYIVRKTT